MGPEKYFQGHRLEILCLVLFQALEGHFPLLIFRIPAFGCFNFASLEVSSPAELF
jgi:hypothetical protein